MFGPARPDVAAEMPALETRVFALVQDERHKIDPKAHELVLDPKLVEIARKRSAQMARSNSFTGSGDPHGSASMLMSMDAKFQGLIGENVAAQHYSPNQAIDVEEFAKRFVQGWIASKPHQENLAFADYDRSGVGAAVSGDTVFLTQLFTTDLGLGAKTDQNDAPSVEPVASPQDGKDDSKDAVPLRGAIVPAKPSN